MAFRRSSVEELAAMRSRGQRPEGFVVVGESNACRDWAARNRFFFVPASQVDGENVDVFVGLPVLVRERLTQGLDDVAQAIALVARMVTLFDPRTGTSEFLVA